MNLCLSRLSCFSSTLGLDFLLPDGDEYKLVFISSDSSSKEEDVDDNDSSSTASRLVKIYISKALNYYYEISIIQHSKNCVVNLKIIKVLLYIS